MTGEGQVPLMGLPASEAEGASRVLRVLLIAKEFHLQVTVSGEHAWSTVELSRQR